MVFQRLDQGSRQHGDSILGALSFPHQYFPSLEVQILDP